MNSTIESMRLPPENTLSYLEWSDEDLLLEYRTVGNTRVFDELVHRYERELFNYLRRYLGDAEMAEDAFQATFLQVHLKCHRFDSGRRFRPWLYAVATNQAIDARRRNRRHRMVSLDRHYGSTDDESGSLVDLLEGDCPGPLGLLESAEQGQIVRTAVDQLPESLRQVLLLVYFQGLKYREAAEALSIPVGTVKSRLHAAIEKLDQSLTPARCPGHG